ncbi:MAG: hypothetical protein NZ821_05635 [Gloeomargarita sp. SKYB31]|nr:hypothetical protein [Gloeomargarita sp. SKYB31]
MRFYQKDVAGELEMLKDFRLLQAIRQRETAERLREVIARVRARSRDLPLKELDALIEEARADFHRRKGHQSDAD